MFSKILNKISQHKFITVIILLLVCVGGYYGYQSLFKSPIATQYVTAAIAKGTLIVSVAGSGQASVSNQVDIKPKVSGDAIYVGIKNGQEVKAGALLAQIDASDAQKSIRDAETNLENSRLSLEKLKQPADDLSILQAENSLTQTKESKQNAEKNLQKTYEDGFNTVSNAFLDLPTVMSGLQDILFDYTFIPNQANIDYYADAVKIYDSKAEIFRNNTYNLYQNARKNYDQNFADYKSASRFSSTTIIENLISETYDTTKTFAEAVKSTNNLIQFYKDELNKRNITSQTLANTHLTNLNTYTGKTNTHLLNLLSIKQTIEDSKKAIISADRAIAEKTESLAKLKAGTDPLDIQSQELSVKKAENALLDAKEKLADYFIRAPFDGVITKVNIKKGDSISSSAAIATLITKQKLAEISLNEVDAAKVKIGQKTTITFDAIEGLSITGKVSDIDTIGTVTQGVVNYNVKIAFDTQDERVKPGMSLSSTIITDIKQDILLTPNSAIKQQSGVSYVQMVDKTFTGFNNTTSSKSGSSVAIPAANLYMQQVQTGLSNDSITEITNGLKEGDRVVTQTINSDSASTQTQQNTGFSLPGMMR